jgi:Protein of unknown function (DUF2958).
LKKLVTSRKASTRFFIAKFFNPAGRQTWYATEYDKETNICFGYVTGMDFDEWRTFSIEELESLKLPYGLKIERDLFFQETRSNKFIRDREQELEL